MNNNFEYLKKEAMKEAQTREADRIRYIAEYDNSLRNESTETRWDQYTNGKITREQAVEYATKRIKKDIEKKLNKTLEHLDAVAQAPELTYISIITWYTRGYTCKAEIRTNTGYYEGSAGGYGYDKESAAVAECFNKDLAILKALYTIKETALKEGQTDESKTACTGRDNRDIIGYGAGYTAIPYFEGGVGIECFFRILEKAGYKTETHWGRKENHYHTYVA